MEVPTMDDNLTTIKKFIREATDWANTIIRVERRRLESGKEGRIEFFDEEVFALEEYSGVSTRKGLLGLGLRKRKDELLEQAEALSEFIQYADPFEVEYERDEKFQRAYNSFTRANGVELTEDEYEKMVKVLGNMDMSQWGYEDRKSSATGGAANDNLIGNVINLIQEDIDVKDIIKIVLDTEKAVKGGTQEDMITELTRRVDDFLSRR